MGIVGKFKDDFNSMAIQQAKLDQSILKHLVERSDDTKEYIEGLPVLKLTIIDEIQENRKVTKDSLSLLYQITDILGTAARRKAREKEQKIRNVGRRKQKRMLGIIEKELEDLEEAKLVLIHAADPPPPDDIPTVMRFANTFDFYIDILFKAIGDHSEYTESYLLDQSEKAYSRRSSDMIASLMESQQYKKPKE